MAGRQDNYLICLLEKMSGYKEVRYGSQLQVLHKHEQPQSFVVRTADGRLYKRNRKYLRKTDEKPCPSTNEQDTDTTTLTQGWKTATKVRTNRLHTHINLNTPNERSETRSYQNIPGGQVSIPLKRAWERERGYSHTALLCTENEVEPGADCRELHGAQDLQNAIQTDEYNNKLTDGCNSLSRWDQQLVRCLAALCVCVCVCGVLSFCFHMCVYWLQPLWTLCSSYASLHCLPRWLLYP